MLDRVAKVTNKYIKQQKPKDILEERQTRLQMVFSKYRGLERKNNNH
jgi:hypothetical protein